MLLRHPKCWSTLITCWREPVNARKRIDEDPSILTEKLRVGVLVDSRRLLDGEAGGFELAGKQVAKFLQFTLQPAGFLPGLENEGILISREMSIGVVVDDLGAALVVLGFRALDVPGQLLRHLAHAHQA